MAMNGRLVFLLCLVTHSEIVFTSLKGGIKLFTNFSCFKLSFKLVVLSLSIECLQNNFAGILKVYLEKVSGNSFLVRDE